MGNMVNSEDNIKQFDYLIKKITNSADYSELIQLFHCLKQDKVQQIINEPNSNNLYLHKIELAHYQTIIDSFEGYRAQYAGKF